MAQRVLFGAFGSSSGTTPLPWPTNTPAPTLTDDLLPMMTLGCGERLDRVPSGQMMASPDSKPRRPSSQVTSAPSRVQACASAGPAPVAAIADMPAANKSARPMVMSFSWLDRHASQSYLVICFRFFGPKIREPDTDENAEIIQPIQLFEEISAITAALTCKSRHAPSREWHPERWPSGLRRTLGKRVCGKPYRGFESHSLRQY
jgi:hypothetical protein